MHLPKPSLLIAAPAMQDPFFAGSVVVLWHHDDDGDIGVIVNRPLEERALADLLDNADIKSGDHIHLIWGGPVETGYGTLITRHEVPDDQGWNIEGIGISRSMDVLLELANEGVELMLCLGYAGWGPGQLDDEIAAGSWLWTDIDPRLIFEVPPEDRYKAALATLGLTPDTLWMPPIDE